MKKFLLSSLAVLGLGTASFAQTAKTIVFGVNVGYNASTVTADNMTNSDYRSGFNAGVFADYYFSEKWSIKGKLSYDQKGWDSGFLSTELGTNKTNYKLDYITIPVLANWHFGRTKNWYLDFGPYLGILVNAKETASGYDLKDFMNTADAGLDLGIGVKFPVSEKTRFFIELNGQAGLTDVIKNNQGSTVRNSTSSINIGFTF